MSFADKIEQFQKDFDNGAHQTIQNATQTLFEAIIEDSPVATGEFKSNWRERINENVSILENDSPYGEKLEYGSSDQAPHGMVRLNTQKWEAIMDKEAKKELP